MNPLIQGHSGTTPDMSQNAFNTNQGTNEDDSQSDPHPEAGLFNNQMIQNYGPEDGHYMVTGVGSGQKDRRDMVTGVTEQTRNGQKDRRDMVTGVQRESLCGLDMVRGVQRESLCQRDLVTGAQEEVTYCSPSITSGKQKKNHSTSQPQLHNENTPATIEADQILLVLQQLAKKNSSANFHNNINRISKLPKSLTTTMPTFDGKSEKLSCLKIYSRRASKYIMSLLKMTESITSILS